MRLEESLKNEILARLMPLQPEKIILFGSYAYGELLIPILKRLDTLHIDAWYPGEFGLLPGGKPTMEDAHAFYRLAQDVYTKVCAVLEQPADRHEENDDNES